MPISDSGFKKGLPRAAVIPAAVLCFITVVWALGGRAAHDFRDRCHTCHVGPKDPSILTKNADTLCLACHPEQKDLTHPTGVVPQRRVPEAFPLFKGKMMCVTCHVAHETYDGADLEHKKHDGNPFLLRFKKSGRVFCYQCHDGGSGGFMFRKSDSHAVGFEAAHGLKKDFKLRKALDDDSRECLGCHDGTLSRDTNTPVAGLSWEHSGEIGVSHPIGVDYKKAFSKKPNRYRNPVSLDKRIMLVNDKIVCQSCHTHFSKFEKMLVMDNQRSKLCLGCHNL